MDVRYIPGFKARISRCGKFAAGVYFGFLSQGTIRAGYRCISVLADNGKRKKLSVHRAVWMAWMGPIPEGIWINHKDGDKLNNSLENLEMVTPSQNQLHAYRVLKCNRATGQRCHTAKLSPEDIQEILRLSKAGTSQRKLSKQFGVSQPAIQQQLKKLR